MHSLNDPDIAVISTSKKHNRHIHHNKLHINHPSTRRNDKIRLKQKEGVNRDRKMTTQRDISAMALYVSSLKDGKMFESDKRFHMSFPI